MPSTASAAKPPSLPSVPSDITIAQAASMQRVAALARERLGIADEHLEPYGH